MEPEKPRASAISRRQLLGGLAAGTGLYAAGRVGSAWAAQAPVRRSGLAVGPGSLPDPSLPAGTDTMPQVEHVIIYMQENHSYDNYFGLLNRGDGLSLDGSGRPTNTNPDLQGNPVSMFHLETCDRSDSASQSWNASHISWDGGAMDGFVRAAGGGTGSMGYYDHTDLPFYDGLAKTFPICDRWFCSMLGQTFPNRRYLQAATSVGIVSTDVAEVVATPTAPNGVIWERLDDHGISWLDYCIDLPDIFLFPTYGTQKQDHVKHFADFLSDCLHGTLPQVSIISPGDTTYTEESPADVQNGEAYSASIINAVMNSPAWEKTVLFFTYDEHGGYYDHVPPPPAIAPDNIAPRITAPPDQPGGFDRYGMRVPGFVISPFAKANYVSHVVHDHTSILKFIETKFNLEAMTFRDANADDLLDTLDFVNVPFREPPTLPAPGLQASGSTCQPLPTPPTNPARETTTTTSPTVPSSDPSTLKPTTSELIGFVTGTPVAAVSPAAVTAQPVAASPTFTG
jgi:phospholipase C